MGEPVNFPEPAFSPLETRDHIIQPLVNREHSCQKRIDSRWGWGGQKTLSGIIHLTRTPGHCQAPQGCPALPGVSRGLDSRFERPFGAVSLQSEGSPRAQEKTPAPHTRATVQSVSEGGARGGFSAEARVKKSGEVPDPPAPPPRGHPSQGKLPNHPGGRERFIRKPGRSHPRPGKPGPDPLPLEGARLSRPPSSPFPALGTPSFHQGRQQPGHRAPHPGRHESFPCSPRQGFKIKTRRGGSLNKNRKLDFFF